MARARVEGLQKLRARIADLSSMADKDARGRAATVSADVMNTAAQFVRDSIRSAASAGGWPQRTIKTIFKFGDLAEGQLPRSVKASLVGIRKGAPPRRDDEIYREWRASANNKSPNRKRGGGELVGMSLAAMYEFGTTKMAARPAFRDTFQRLRGQVRKMLIEGHKRVIEEFNR